MQATKIGTMYWEAYRDVMSAVLALLCSTLVFMGVSPASHLSTGLIQIFQK